MPVGWRKGFSRGPKPPGQSNLPPRPGVSAKLPTAKSGQFGRFKTAWEQRLFTLFWGAGFLPHWRIVIPVGLTVVVLSLVLPRTPSFNAVQTSGSSADPVKSDGPTPKISQSVNGGTVFEYSSIPYEAYLPELRKLTDKYPLPIYVSMTKSAVGAVWALNVERIDNLTFMGEVSGLPDIERMPIEKDLTSMIAKGAAILECEYYTGNSIGKFYIARYWYQTRPEEAELARMRRLSPRHPLLLRPVKSARNNCPPTRREADSSV